MGLIIGVVLLHSPHTHLEPSEFWLKPLLRRLIKGRASRASGLFVGRILRTHENVSDQNLQITWKWKMEVATAR